MESAMQAWALKHPDGLQALSLITVAKPIPKKDEICVKVAAVGLNAIDYKLTDSGYPTWNYPQVIGSDVAGIIESIGDDVHHFICGDRVMFFADPRQASGFAEYVCIKATAVSRIPLTLSFTDAATLPYAGYSAWIAVHDKLQIKAGQHIAITGAGSGVGGFATQLAAQAGAHVYAIAERQHHSRLLNYGIKAVFAPDQNIAFEIIKSTEDHMLHGVIECTSTKSGHRMSKLLRYNGHIVMIANQFNKVPVSATTKALSLHEVELYNTYAYGSPDQITHIADIGNTLSDLVAEGQLHSMVDKIVPFPKLAEALKELKAQTHSGKIVVHVN